VAFELLAGRRPFESESTTAEAARHATAAVPSIRKLKPELPARFDAVFERALAKEAAARYPSAAEFVAELRTALHDDAGTTGWIMPASATSTAITQISRPAPSRGNLRRTDGKDMRPRRDGGCSLCCSRSCSGAESPRLSQQPAMLSHAQFHRSGSR
jgi:serine/threonine protein kinase